MAGVAEADYINKQLMEILAPKTDYLAVRAAEQFGLWGLALRLAGIAAAPSSTLHQCHSIMHHHPWLCCLAGLPQEFLAIQNQQPRNLGFFGTRNMGFMHQQLIEVLSYAMLLTVSGRLMD